VDSTEQSPGVIEQCWQWSNQPPSGESSLYTIHRSPAPGCISAEAEFHQYHSGKKTDDVTHTAKNPIGVEIGAQVIDKHVGI
jgi:hypothetical protein